MLRADAVEHERESLHGGDDDLLAAFEELRELLGLRNARAFLDRADNIAHLGEALDRLADLLVEDAPVGDDDDRVKNFLAVLARADELVRQPRDAIGLAAARRVLDEVTLARALLPHIGQELPHHVELVVTRENLHLLLLPGLRVLLLHDLRVVLQNLGQARRLQDVLPEVIRLQPHRVRRVARAVIPALVERQKPRILRHAFAALEGGAHRHLRVVHGEMHHAAAKLEQRLARISVALVLLYGVLDGLLGQAVL